MLRISAVVFAAGLRCSEHLHPGGRRGAISRGRAARKGERHGERVALYADLQPAAEILHERLRDGKPQAAAFGGAAGVSPHKALEHVVRGEVHFVGRGVRQRQAGGDVAPGDLQINARAHQRIAQRIVQDVLQHAVQLAAVRLHDGALRHCRLYRNACVPDGVVHITQCLAHGHYKVQRFDGQRFAAAGGLGQREQVRHSGGQPFGLLPQDEHIVPCPGGQVVLLFQKVQIADDACEGRFQVVGDICDEVQLHAFAFHLGSHAFLQMGADVRYGLGSSVQAAVLGNADRRGVALCGNIKLAQKCVEALCVPIRAPYKISGACRHHKNGEHGEGGIAP